jgi:hypothetical protein
LRLITAVVAEWRGAIAATKLCVCRSNGWRFADSWRLLDGLMFFRGLFSVCNVVGCLLCLKQAYLLIVEGHVLE